MNLSQASCFICETANTQVYTNAHFFGKEYHCTNCGVYKLVETAEVNLDNDPSFPLLRPKIAQVVAERRKNDSISCFMVTFDSQNNEDIIIWGEDRFTLQDFVNGSQIQLPLSPIGSENIRMIITPAEKKDQLLLRSLKTVAEFHKRNENSERRYHLDIDRLPEDVRQNLLSLCTNHDKRACLLDFEITPVNRTLVKTAGGFALDGCNLQPFIYGLAEAGWKKYQELDCKYSTPQFDPPTAACASLKSELTSPDLTKMASYVTQPIKRRDDSTKRFKIAFSFAGEYRDIIEEAVNELLADFNEKEILYDKFHKAEFARPNLDVVLPRLYLDETELNTIWLCKEYRSKSWCGVEFRAIRQRMNQGDAESIFIVKLDDAEIEGIYDTVDGYINIKHDPPKMIAKYIRERYSQLYPAE